MDISTFDRLLRDALLHLRETSIDNKGPVAAGLESQGKTVYAVSEKRGENWLHAEHKVLQKFTSRHGAIGDDAVMAVSLSPCKSETLSRHGPPCTELLRGEGLGIDVSVDRIHVGLVDEKEATLDQYRRMGFDITCTESEQLRTCCQRLETFFELPHEQRDSAFINQALRQL
ncbi:MAG: hypothetical protein SVY41_00440 [Candidatus Nanohaloarchaea archaeon]|nr:hypothetical protein [Candidatus Nanohaloarchaea archaeon]